MSYRKSRHLKQKHRRIADWPRQSHEALAVRGITPEDSVALERAIYGHVVLPGDPDFDQARQLWNPAFQRLPLLIVYCETAGDVRQCLAFARRFDLRVTCRSGGHSTAGYSIGDDALVVDTSRMQYVHLVPAKGDDAVPMAHVGAGSQWGFVAATLGGYGLHVPGGDCEDVCVAGYMQGGGYGYTSRMFGMNCDNVVEVKVMLADGRIVIANERQNIPLFWAIRGGMGNNFGVLLDVTYRLYRPQALWGFGIKWPIDHAPRAIFELQNGFMKTNRSRKIGYQTYGASAEGTQTVMMRGMYRGSEDEALEALAPVLSTPGAHLEFGYAGVYHEIIRRLGEDLIAGIPEGAKEDKQSGYLRAPLSLAEWEEVIAMFARVPCPYGLFNIEAYGAAINDVAAGSNAFVHRDAFCNFYLDVFWTDDNERTEAVGYLDRFMAMMQPLFDRPDGRPRANQNYPRAVQTNHLDLYFDGFVGDLVAAKRLYDPANLFGYEQGIPLEIPVDARRDPASPGFTGDEEIIVEPH